jgi:acyl-CoA thioesterase-1
MTRDHTMTVWLMALALALFNSGCGDSSAGRREAETNGRELPANKPTERHSKPVILFFGNSLSAGYGLAPEEAFPALIQQRLDSLGRDYRVVNAGVSGETSAGGLGRVDWVLRQAVDIFVLELGGNDGLRGIPPAETKANLQAIIDAVRNKYPQARIILAGMEAPPNMGQAYTTAFRRIFSELAQANDIALIPFLLEGVGGEAALNLPDGIHPNAEGAKIVADNVWEVLFPLL